MTTPSPRFKLLFLCTGNTARSILAEFLLRKIAPDKFEAFSAGSQPASAPNPLALRTLQDQFAIDTSGARSKSWDEYINHIDFDFIITLCDDAKESCPVWPGHPVTAHWPLPDPAAAKGTEEEQLKVFWLTAQRLARRIELFSSLPFEKLSTLQLTQATRDIPHRGDSGE